MFVLQIADMVGIEQWRQAIGLSHRKRCFDEPRRRSKDGWEEYDEWMMKCSHDRLRWRRWKQSLELKRRNGRKLNTLNMQEIFHWKYFLSEWISIVISIILTIVSGAYFGSHTKIQ